MGPALRHLRSVMLCNDAFCAEEDTGVEGCCELRHGHLICGAFVEQEPARLALDLGFVMPPDVSDVCHLRYLAQKSCQEKYRVYLSRNRCIGMGQ